MVRPTQTFSMDELLSTKLSLPRLRSPRVLRGSLLSRLDAGLEGKLTLLSAPAGFGKTTLAAEWVSGFRNSKLETRNLQFSWVSLDAGDNDPLRFWRYVFNVIQAFDPEAGSTALRMLHAAQQPHYETVLTGLINGIAQRSGKHVLVLEDYHFITNPQIHAAVAFLLDHLPPSLHLVLLTRRDPPLPLARLRAHNEINELRALDLRFTEAETGDFLLQAIPANPLRPHPISAEMSARLAQRTEGWAAGLRLVALALQGRPDLGEMERFIDTFTGSHRPILEYLVADVLAAQKEPIQEFLLETSFLNRLTGSLCDAVTGRNDSGRILDGIERANLFLEPLDGGGQWYRFHGLFAEAMQYTARQRLGEPRLRRLACSASSWYEENGMLSEAVETALYAQAFERAADLIERISEARLVGNEYHTLLRWLEDLPEGEFRTHPSLCTTYAQAILFTSEVGAPVPVDRLGALLEMAEQVWASEGNGSKLGGLLAFRALIAVRQGEYPRAFSLTRQALEKLPESGSPESGSLQTSHLTWVTEWRGVSLIFAGWEAYLAGRLIPARQLLAEARALLQAVGNIYGLLDATLGLGEIHARLAEPQQAAELYRQALAEIDRAPIERKDKLRRRGRALLGLAALAYERNDLEAARQDADQAAAIGDEICGEELIAHGEWILARLQRARGEIEPARNRLNTLAARTKRPQLLREIQAWQAWLALTAGDLASVQRWPAARDLPGDDLPALNREGEALILARLQIAQGQAGEALRHLEGWLADAQAQGRARSELEIRMITAQAEAALGRHPQARQSLVQALRLAKPGGYLRVFLDEGEPLAAVLRAAAAEQGEEPEAGFARTLLLTRDEGRTGPEPRSSPVHGVIGEPLSQQEARILRLLGAGLSNPEIAEELVVSVNTVKTHVKSIYRKLNVNNRRAVREATLHLKLQTGIKPR